ncbi:MAG: Scr1 family TA system antitoxin-like transcriptional regulator, partial [Pseudonocardiaceae bacterium]
MAARAVAALLPGLPRIRRIVREARHTDWPRSARVAIVAWRQAATRRSITTRRARLSPLVRCARDNRVAADQLSQLVDRAAWPNIELRVLPFDAGLHVGMNGPFSLLSFPDDLLADVAYHEYPVGGHIID